jgi:hypothetical protein
MFHQNSCCCLAIAWFLLATGAQAAEIFPPANLRFQNAQGDEQPDLRRHVLPLLGRLGCNGRACHGSFQGQGGFRLSLFGYDFAADHAALASGAKPRIDSKDPLQSLILQKSTKTVDHEGGQRITKDSWQYHLLLRWIQAGAKSVNETDAEIGSLAVEPQQIVFKKLGDSAQLTIIAHWTDGTREDVTPLCRFRSNDESTATINDTGLVISTGKGDTDVVVFYDNGVAPVQVIQPVSEYRGSKYPKVPTPTKVDELVVAKLSQLGVIPAGICTDAEFLRRVSLDMSGTLPAPEEILAFLESKAEDKRAKKIEELQTRPAYAAWWTTKLCDLTGNTAALGPQGGEQSLNREKARLWYEWIYRRVEQNVPYDELVAGIVLAVSRAPEQSFAEYSAETSSYFRKEQPADFATRASMPYYWTRRQLGSSTGKALAFSYSFLGVSLQCAECHKHPYDQWTKQDFDQFAVFFDGVNYGTGNRQQAQEMKKALGLMGDEDSGDYKRKFVELVQQGKVLPFNELRVPTPSKNAKNAKPRPNKAGRVITPRLLGGEEVLTNSYADPRQPLMDWMRQEDNPYFARAFVNRVWANYFHSGIIETTDDLNLANPPSNPALLDYLADGFRQHGYDMKWLHREIANSRTYQLSCRPNSTNQQDERNFSRGVIRRLPAEVTYDALLYATASDEARQSLDRQPNTLRAIGVTTGFTGRDSGPSAYAVNLFGKPPRTINCDCERSVEPSLLQIVYLRNDQEVQAMIDHKDGWLQQVGSGVAKPTSPRAVEKPLDVEHLIREAYLRTLSRLPTQQEAASSREHLQKATDRLTGLRDLLWALLNTKEFVVNH